MNEVRSTSVHLPTLLLTSPLQGKTGWARKVGWCQVDSLAQWTGKGEARIPAAQMAQRVREWRRLQGLVFFIVLYKVGLEKTKSLH